MESVPNEVVDLIIKNLDLETNYNLSLVNSKMYSSTKRHLKPTITYYKNGRVESKTWISRNKSGDIIKRVIDYFNNATNSKNFETWYKNDLFHKEGKPAYRRWYIDGNKASESWYENNLLHRENGPATTRWLPNGKKAEEIWYENDIEVHRVDY